MIPVSTFSIVARDPETGDLGVAVASKFLAVGAVVPFAQAGVGAIATQSYANTSFGPRSMVMLAAGAAPDLVVRAFRESDKEIGLRQFGLVDASGRSATFTGDGCHPWAGGKSGLNYAAQGNLLAGPEVVDALVETFLQNDGLPLSERLLAALLAGDRAGGDRRGRQSAALLVVGEGKGYGGFNDRWVDLRVDDHSDPVPELQRLLEIHGLLFGSSGQARELEAGEVRWLQEALRQLGFYDGPVDGLWSEGLEKALVAWLGRENLEERYQGGPYLEDAVLRALRRSVAS